MTFVADPITRGYAKQADSSDRAAGPVNLIIHPLSSVGSDASEDGTGRGTPLVWQGGSQQDQIIEEGGVVPTLAHSSNTHQGNHQPKLINATGVRRLTPTECEHLQGLPDGWTLPGPDSRRYAGIGDAVTANVAEWIGRRLLA